MVAQTTKNVGTFAELKTAVENIPQFEALKGLKEAYIAAQSASKTAAEEVTTATTAYQTAVSKTTEAKEAYEKDPNHTKAIENEQQYNAAVAQVDKAEKEYNTKMATAEKLRGELPGLQTAVTEREKEYNEAKKIVDDWAGPKTKPGEPEIKTITENKPYPEYTIFYNAVKTISTETTPILYYGIVDMGYEEIVVFATGVGIKEKVNKQISDDEGYDVVWYTKDIAPRNLKPGNNNPNYDKDLASFIIEETTYTPAKCRFYYYENESTIAYGEYEFTTVIKNVLTAIVKTYENLKREFTETIEVPTVVDTDEYAQAKQDMQDALDKWKAAIAAVEAKEKAIKEAEDAAKTALSDMSLWNGIATTRYNNWQTALNAEKPTREKWEAAQRAEEEALAAKTAAETKKEKADEAVETAKTNYNNAARSLLGDDELVYDDENLIICEAYTTIAIKANLTGVSTITKWPANYVLDGEGHFVETTGALFELNEGTIKNLATPNGHIAEDNKGKVSLCLTKWDKQYRVYTLSGNYESHNTAEDAIYSMREVGEFKFGYNVETGKVVPIASDTKLYQGTYANAENSEPISFKLNISNNSLKINQSILGEMVTDGRSLKENAIVYIENNDAIGTGIENVENIAIKGATATSSYTCYNTVLTDDDSAREFYIPGNSDEKKNYNFSSKRVTYARNFNQKYAAVCFPFTLTKAQQTALGIEAAYQFKEVNTETGIMWFSLLEEAPANEPCLIVFKDSEFEGNSTPGSIFANYKETASFQFKETPDKLVALDTNDKETFYGTYKLNTVRGLLGKNSTDAIYGIVKGELVKMTGDNTKFKAFRSYVRTVNIPTTSGAPSYKIGLMDEDGNELSTAIETVTGEIVSGFKAKGGDNVIEIVTNEACPVKVYALNGALVKSTRVEAGVTSLPVKAGIYVVNGTKVIVK